MQVTELIPLNCRQKSFYGKAKVINLNDAVALKSYDTIVCIVDYEERGVTKITFPWANWSATTSRHISEFLEQQRIPVRFLMEEITKREPGIKSFKKLLENIRYIEFGEKVDFYYDDDCSRESLQYVDNLIHNYPEAR